MRRRDLITLLGGAAAAWPLAARAQQGGRVRRIGVLFGAAEGESSRLATTALRDGLGKLGWIEGRNLHLEFRYGGADAVRNHAAAEELLKSGPDLMVTFAGIATSAVYQQTRTIPIVFVGIGDPVNWGLLKNIARPEGNATGVTNWYPSLGGKWLELLKEAAPRTTRVALLFGAEANSGTSFDSIAAAAPVLAMQTIKLPVQNAIEIVRAVDNFAAEPNGGVLVVPDATTATHRDTIIQVAAQHRLPAIYAGRTWANAGGLIGYGNDNLSMFQAVPTYVDRLLRGAKVNELPVQFPTKFELVVNLKTAKAISLRIPEAFLLRADEVIE
jgi:ABC-type uncharacterized transport system substrate-binding protein